jgi:hypothetical protein
MSLNMGSLSQYLPQDQQNGWGGGSMNYGASLQMPMSGAPNPIGMGQLDTSGITDGSFAPAGVAGLGSQFQVPGMPDLSGGGGGGGGGFMQGMLGGTNADGTKMNGWGGLALGAASGIANTFMGMKQYGMAKDALKENKRQFNLNYGAQRDSTNTRMEDRQRARVAANSSAQSVDSYMDKNRIK